MVVENMPFPSAIRHIVFSFCKITNPNGHHMSLFGIFEYETQNLASLMVAIICF